VNSRRFLAVLPWAAAAAALVVFHAMADTPALTLLETEALNAGHAILYAVLAMLVLQVFRIGSTRRPFAWAGTLIVVVGALTEVAQIGSGRRAEWQDFARNCLGGAAGLLLAYAFPLRRGTSSAGQELQAASSRRRVAVLVMVVLLFAISFARLAMVSAAYLGRERAFPVICDFRASWTATFVRPSGALLEVVDAPAAWGGSSRGKVGRVTILPGEFPGLILNELHPDWHGYSRFVMEIFSESKDPVKLVLRVHDRQHDEDFYDRFNRQFSIAPGSNRISVPLEEIRTAPKSREMDMKRIQTAVLFSVGPSEPFVFYVGSIRLESADTAAAYSAR
jgi:hypothetical protein